jgi:hypothetical protein
MSSKKLITVDSVIEMLKGWIDENHQEALSFAEEALNCLIDETGEDSEVVQVTFFDAEDLDEMIAEEEMIRGELGEELDSPLFGHPAEEDEEEDE